ncbi:MAG: hypothetical protein HOP07_02420 [Bacteriovoracaceae bacterium]|nr:hypothetical protein [Bacteriovoracaceae bacterium]
MKLLSKIKNRIVTSVIIYSLLNASLLSLTFAQSKKNESSIQPNDILQIMQAATGVYSQYVDFKATTIMQQVQAQKNQQMMQTLSPNCRKPDGTSCYTVKGKYFPECPLPASMSNMPQNVCSSASPNPSQISSMITYESISKGWVNYYDQMMNEASNMEVPFGLKCLQDKQKALSSQIAEMVNNLTRLQDQLNKDKEIFRANNKLLLDEMTSVNDELNGANGSGENNLKLKALDFNQYFSQNCQSVIGQETLSQGKQLGLLGIKQGLTASNKRAADFNSNRAIIESEVRTDVEKLQKAIREGGLQDYFNNNPASTSKFKSVSEAAQKQMSDFSVSTKRIAGELSKIGYELPAMDKNFSLDFNEFIAGSENFFKKQYINDCVTGADKSGIAISTDQILAALQQKSTKNAGTARDKYRAALKGILDSDASIDEKMAKIKALEATYKDISITYQNSEAQRITETPYDLYMKTLTKCEQRYTQDDSFASGGQRGVSQKTKVARGQTLLREIKGLHDNFASNLSSKVLDQALNCNGEAKKSGANCSSEEAFDHTQASFCVSHASSCANEVNGCYAEAEKHVKDRETKMRLMAIQFNKKAEDLRLRSNALYDQQKVAVMDMVKAVQSRFPGTNFLIPEGMFVSLPTLKSDRFGVALANDGDMSFLDELPKKIDLLKEVFKIQQTKVDDEINDYIGKQTAAMAREKERWNSLAGECKSMIDTSSKELARMNAEGQKKQNELDQKVANFCAKYVGIAENPMPACEDAKTLAEDVAAIQSRLSNEATTLTRHFRAACNGYNNEKDVEVASTEDNCSDIPPEKYKEKSKCERELAAARKKNSIATGTKPVKDVPLAALCPSSSTSESDFIKAAANRLPEGKEEILKYNTLSSLETKIESIEDNNFFSEIQRVAASVAGTGDICKKLHAAKDEAPPSDSASSPALKAAQESLTEANSNLKNKTAALETAEKLFKEVPGNAGKSSDADPVVKAAKDQLAAAKEVASAADTKLKEETAKSKVAAAAPNKRVLLQLALNTLQVKPLTLKDQYAQQVRRIGEQSEGTPCDVRASTTAPKLFSGSSLLPVGFDQSRLGTER